ncbi:sodium:solute symporter family transporter [Aquisediminimonas profunda]|uniref:sodium:solute symporter family transporter n=1 Tax=Aquisediminimonas profunda TaxID=1550733 RepID=UPI001C6254B5|nr:sodium/solute symporter [Aquisediminimonas profunda]
MTVALTSTGSGQVAVFISITLMIGVATWLKVRSSTGEHDGSGKDVFLAGGGLTWLYIAGSITLTNLSTEQLVGMNGNQMLLLSWWEICGFFGLLILAFVFVPIYYRNNCTTVTELLERRYNGGSIRTVISAIFLLGNILIYLPAALYSGSLFLKSMFGVSWPLVTFAAPLAIIAALYTITGGLRAVAVMDTFSGIGVLAIALLVVVLALAAIDFDLFSGVPAERVSMIGASDSPIPFHTLFTGMLFIQIFYWSTNQNITQKAMTAPTVREAQKGVLAAAAVRILIIPAIVVIPGVVGYKLFGPMGDASYGKVVAHVLPEWLSGAFAALMAAAVIAHTSAILNSSVALYSIDFHDKFIRQVQDHWRLAAIASAGFTITSILLVPAFEDAKSIINLLQELNGLSSMPVLSAFIAGLLFANVDARAAVIGLIYGVGVYALHTFVLYKPGAVYAGETFYEHIGLPSLHYIDVMVIVLATSVSVALVANRLIFGNHARYIGPGVIRHV